MIGDNNMEELIDDPCWIPSRALYYLKKAFIISVMNLKYYNICYNNNGQ